MKNRKFIFTACILGIILVSEAMLTGILPMSRGYLYDILEIKQGAVWFAIGCYFMNYLGLDFFQSIKKYFVVKTGLLLRQYRSKKMLTQETICLIQNYPQRIQEDIKLSYVCRLQVYCEYFVSGAILCYLISVNLSSPVLILGAVGYAAVSVVIALLFNPRLTAAEKLSQETEATFRERIASALGSSFQFLLTTTNPTVLRAEAISTQYVLFTKLQLGLMSVLPYIVLIEPLFAGEITLGTLVANSATFSLIVVNAAILIRYFPRLIKGRASEQRVKKMQRPLDNQE